MTRAVPASSAALPIDEVMRTSPSLMRLTERLRESKAMFASVSPLFPAALVPSLQPGPLDDEGWSILGANAAVAAKLRQLVPRLEARLRDRGHRVATVRIKVLTP